MNEETYSYVRELEWKVFATSTAYQDDIMIAGVAGQI
jgi:hypothetical protein